MIIFNWLFWIGRLVYNVCSCDMNTNQQESQCRQGNGLMEMVMFAMHDAWRSPPVFDTPLENNALWPCTLGSKAPYLCTKITHCRAPLSPALHTWQLMQALKSPARFPSKDARQLRSEDHWQEVWATLSLRTGITEHSPYFIPILNLSLCSLLQQSLIFSASFHFT